MKRSAAQPTQMSIAIGAGLSDSFSAVLDGDDLTYVYRPWTGEEERATVIPGWEQAAQPAETAAKGS